MLEDNVEDLVYMAAVVDCEGCIGLTAHTSKATLHGRRYKPETQGKVYGYYRRITLYVSVGMTVREIPEWFYLRFGGTLSLNKREGNYKDRWIWRVGNNKALHCVKTLLPYLKIKRAQAELATVFQESRVKYGRHTTDIQKQIDEIMLAKSHELNRVGRET